MTSRNRIRIRRGEKETMGSSRNSRRRKAVPAEVAPAPVRQAATLHPQMAMGMARPPLNWERLV